MRIKMSGIHVVDPERAYEFYTGTLGLEPLMAMPEYNLFIVCSPEDPGGPGLLLEPSDNPVAEAYRTGLYREQLPVLVLGVPDVQAEYERLSGLGVQFLGEPTLDSTGAQAVFDDGCGNYLQLHQD
ncbi:MULTISPECIES: VOC family protein [unclassified Arthrobacter]|uniref:VOC family protein n=1 Tax=unclassified Arthrobacter TaxID=235627 RepID=UPI001D146817|nr:MULTISPECIES: VOC family protein [unclassified Arthrobacter]MCC3289531.1 VOC family protein [Arthrobacter sp. zg-Y1110]MCC3300951.1 VOC family protein [Arthrobacter sp. zg-Y895]MCQ1946342.1 VOC family protein [Arthrobacter sp. zg-Y1116]MCQ1986283.1 VOC family protein [Arthrobacter sp. zg-Y844]MCQ1993978.1 VOC family protein [Arthrobacter sp. zg-Y1171]